MWHEARRQERKIRGMIVDYRKRAERRQDFYEKIKADPTQFLQLHGRKCKIHLDPAVAAAGDGAAIIVPWQGQQDNLIDRFDVRAHLDYIPPVPKASLQEDIGPEERQCNYERYRILAQNDFLNVSEEKFLHQLYLDEQYGANAQVEADRNMGKKKATGVAIAYSYDDADASTPFSHIPSATVHQADDDNDSVGSEIDMDVSIDISKLDTSQAHELNACGRNYGMLSNDFYSYLTKDVDEADAMRLAREEEQEKMMLSGRKSRRERRAQKERRVAGRPLSPPSYAAKEEPAPGDAKDNDSDSRSPSPENSGKITYITSFGGEDELQPHSKILINMNKTNKPGLGAGISPAGQVTYAQKVKENLEKLKQANERRQERPKQYQYRSRSRSYGRHRRSSSRSRRRRSRSRSYGRRYRRSRSRSRRSRSQSRSRRSNSRSRRKRRYSSSSRSSSSSSGDREATRSKASPKHCQSLSKANAKTFERPEEVVNPPPSVPVLEPPPAPPMIQYPILPILRPTNPTPQQAPEPIKQADLPQPLPEEPPPIKRYYGRKRPGDTSDSDEDTSNADDPSDDDRSHDEDRYEQVLMDIDTSSDRSNPFPHLSSGAAGSSGSGSGKQNSKNALSTHGTNISNSTETKVGMSNAGTGVGANKAPLNPRERLKRKMQILLNKQYKADKKAEIEKTERQLQMQQEREDEMRELALKLRRRQRELRHKHGTPKSSDGARSSDEETAPKKARSRSTSQSSKKSVKSTRSNHRNSREGDRDRERDRDRDRTRSRRSSSRGRHRRRSRSRSRSTGHRARRRNSRSRSRNRRSTSRRRNRSTDRSRYRESRDHRDRYRRSRSRSRTNTGNRNRDPDRWASSYSRNCDRGSNVAAQVTENERNNRNKIVISAPPKLKKLVDY